MAIVIIRKYQKENMDTTTNYIVRQIEQLIFFGHFYDAEHLTNIS